MYCNLVSAFVLKEYVPDQNIANFQSQKFDFTFTLDILDFIGIYLKARTCSFGGADLHYLIRDKIL